MHARRSVMLSMMLRLETVPAAELAARPAGWWDDVLGIARYAAHPRVQLPAVPCAEVQVDALGGIVEPCEVWHAASKPREGRVDALHWRADDNVLFATQVLPVGAGGLEDVSRDAYARLFATLDATGYPHLLRVWNHISEINAELDGLEQYRRFNIGRQDAFLAHDRGIAGTSVPAASALGAHAGAPLAVYALALREAPQAIENPRQVSAYHYPAQYGPRAPMFSRATLVDVGGPLLFISGTASIVGHSSLHAGDVLEQTREILRNIRALLEQAHARGAPAWSLRNLDYKVYLRHSDDFERVRGMLREAAGTAVRALFLHADICRSDLQVEIEATAPSGGNAA